MWHNIFVLSVTDPFLVSWSWETKQRTSSYRHALDHARVPSFFVPSCMPSLTPMPSYTHNLIPHTSCVNALVHACPVCPVSSECLMSSDLLMSGHHAHKPKRCGGGGGDSSLSPPRPANAKVLGINDLYWIFLAVFYFYLVSATSST